MIYIDKRLIAAWDKIISKIESWVDLFILSLPNLIIAVLVFTLVIFASKYIGKLTQKILSKTTIQRSMKDLITKIVSVVVVLFGLFFILSILHLDKALNAILAGAGVAGLAVGLALQGALSNTYSGILLSYVKNLQYGDWIESNGFEGEVIDIDFRVVTIRQIDNNLVYIPNKLVVENSLKNYSQNSRSKVIITCGVGYESNLRMVKQLAIDTVVNNFKDVKSKEQTQFFWKEFGDSAINFELRFWIDCKSPLEVAYAKSETVMLLKEAFDANSVNIPFPIRTLNFPKDFMKTIKNV